MGNSRSKSRTRKSDIKIRLTEKDNESLRMYNMDKFVDPTISREMSIVKHNGNYDNLVLSGGGVKGIAHCGAVKFLEEKGIMKNIKRIAGTSVGAIFATMIAVGYSGDEMTEEILKLNLDHLKDDNVNIFEDFYRLVNGYGWCPGGYIRLLMGQLIHKKTENNDYTFEDLIKDKGIDLVLTATDLNTRNTVFFNYTHTPKMPIRDAVRMSMSIPFLFTPVEYKGHLLVDGGVLDQCPEHIFDGDRRRSGVEELSKLNLTKVNPKTLAFDILEPDEHPNFQFEDTKKISNLKDFGAQLLGTLITGNERRYMRPAFWKRTVAIYVPKIPLTQFKLNKEQKEHLFECGYQACQKFFE